MEFSRHGLRVVVRRAIGRLLPARCAWLLSLLGLLLQSAPGQAAAPVAVSVVDVLVLHTPAATAESGGVGAMSAQIELALAEANLVFQNSRADVRLRLAHRTEVAYAESGSVWTDLERLRTANDGFLDEVHTLRTQHAADLVCLIAATGSDYSFYGLQGPSTQNAFSVIRRRYLTGDWFLPVVLSFNFGCQLERPYADSVGAFPFSYGYTAQTDFGWFSSVEALDGTRLAYFSNPELELGGEGDTPEFRLGVPEGQPGSANNVKTLNLTAPLVAAFLGEAARTLPPVVRLTIPTNGSAIATNSLTIAADASDPDGVVRRVSFFVQDEEGGPLIALSSATNVPWSVTMRGFPSGRLTLLAQAVDNAGASTFDRVRMSVTNEPMVRITSPASGARSSAGLPLVVEAEATAAPGSAIARVEFLLESNLIGVATNAPFTALWTNPQPSYAMLTARAMDTDGVRGTSAVVSVTITPPNDDFANASVLTGTNLVFVAANLYASIEPGEPWHAGYPIGASLWWNWTAPVGGRVSIIVHSQRTVGNLYYPSLAVYTGTVVSNLTPRAASSGYLTSAVALDVAAGETFRIAMDGEFGSVGDFSLRLEFTPASLNDDFEARIGLGDARADVAGTLVGAGRQTGEPNHAGAAGGHSLWWAWTAPVSGNVEVSVSANGFTPLMAVYTGNSLATLQSLGGVTNQILTFPADAGQTYSIVVDGLSGGFGTFDLHVVGPPPNDLFANRLALPDAPGFVSGWTTQAGREVGEPDHGGGPAGHSGWWSWLPTASGAVEFSVAAGGFTPLLAIYTGEDLAHLTPLVRGTNCPLTVRPVPGVAYHFAVDGWGGGSGDYTLSLVAAPLNDDFANAIPLSGLSAAWRGTNVAASREPGEPVPPDGHAGKTVWWSWTAPVSGSVALDPFGTAYNARLAVYGGSALSNLVLLDRTEGQVGDWLGFYAIAGRTYWIAADSFNQGCNSSSGELVVNLNETPAPSNDDFSGRITLTGTNFSLPANNSGASHEAGEPDLGLSASRSLWWTWTAPITGQAVFRADPAWGTGMQMGLGTFTGNAVTNLSPVDLREISGYTAFSTVQAAAGVTYQIAVDVWFGGGGPFSLSLTMTPAPPNDHFTNRIVLVGTNVTAAGSTVGATREPGEPLHGGMLGENSIWWSWAAPGDGTANIVVTSQPGVGLLWGVYTGTRVEALTGVTGIDSSTVLRVVAGRVYHIAADGKRSFWDAPAGEVSVRIDFQPYPANDQFANRQLLTGTDVTVVGSNRGATREPGEANLGTAGRSIWWSWTAPADGTATVDTGGSEKQTATRVYTGTALSNLALVTGGNSLVYFAAQAGETYQIWVDEYFSGVGGAVSLRLFFSTLRITLPATGSVFHGSTNLVITAETTPADGTFPLISFRADDNEIGVVSSPPYTFVWSNAPLGVHNLQAVLTNDAGRVISSAYVLVTLRPANDDFALRQPLVGLPAHAVGSSVGATVETGEPVHAGFGGGKSVWYMWTAQASETVSLTLNPRFNRPVAIYTGTALTNLTLIASNAHGVVWFEAMAGTTYQIAIDNFSPPLGPYFALDLLQPPANDRFANRMTLPPEPGTVTVSNLGSTYELGEPSLGPASDFSVWWSWTAPFTGGLRLTAGANGFNSLVAFYTGDTLSNLVRVANILGPVTLDVSAGTTYQIAASGDWYESWAPSFTFLPTAPNDHFANRAALSVSTGVVTGSTAFATSEAGEPNHAGQSGGRSVWWIWTASQSGQARVTVAAPGSTPSLAVSTGDQLGTLAEVAAAAGNSLSWTAMPGMNYAVALDGVPGGSGDFTLTLAFDVPPPNDAFANRTALVGTNVLASASTLAASKEPDEPNHAGHPGGRSVWWTWTAPTSGVVRLTVTGAGATPLLAVYTGASLNALADVATAAAPTLEFTAAAGTTYQLALDTGPAEVTGVGFSLRLTPPPVLPSNDAFADRIPLGPLPAILTADNTIATAEPGEHLPGGASARTVWWTWTAMASATVSVSTEGSVFQGGVGLPGQVGPLVAIYEGDDLATLSLVASNTYYVPPPPRRPPPPGGPWFVVPGFSFDAVGGVTYQISVDGLNGSAGEIVLRWETQQQIPPANDYFADRIALAGAAVSIVASNRFATRELDEPFHADEPGGASVWWSWTAPFTGRARLAVSAPFDVVAGVYSGGSLAALTEVARGSSLTAFDCLAESTYQIAVDGVGGAAGEFQLDLSGSARPPNDRFAERTPLAGSAVAVDGTTEAATREPGEPLHSGSATGASVWYSWTAPASGDVTLAVTGWTAEQPFAVFVGSGVSNLLPIARAPGEDGVYGARFYALAGVTYQIAVSDDSGEESVFTFALNSSPPPPQLATEVSGRLPDGSFRLRVTGTNAQSLVLQASTDLVEWTALAIDTMQGGVWEFVDTEAATVPQRFYRVLPLEALFGNGPLRVANPAAHPGGVFTLAVRGPAGAPFALEASEDFNNWLRVAAGTVVGESFLFVDPEAPARTNRFYRAVPWR